MKKTLLFTFALFLYSTLLVGQGLEKLWNFSNAPFGASPTVTFLASFTHDLLTVGTNGESNWALDSNNKSLDEVSYTHRLKSGGGGSPADGSKIPTTRFLSINVGGNSVIEFAMMSSSSSAEREMYIVNEDESLVDSISAIIGTSLAKYTYTYTGGATKLYFYSKSSGINFYSIKASNVVEGVSSSVSNIFVGEGVRFDGVRLTNESNLSLRVYNTLGKEVARANSEINMSTMPKGVYLVRAEGVKGAFKFSK
ncbi:MAG: T9SS type A sorting domain-containing protein [Paludibacteraceae bacterium]|nr:T9SS type A sorting domain-containing protein [Paludibacteraceae bacterium]